MISVVIQGGAMRSIYCLGAVRALVDRGWASSVRSIHAASAGCISAMVLASNITAASASSVKEMGSQLVAQLAGPRFIDQRRLRKIVDVDYLVGVTTAVTSVGADNLRESGLLFEVSLTDADTARPRYLDLSAAASDHDLALGLAATMAIPVLYPTPVFIEGRRYVDGGITDPLPLMRALRTEPRRVVAISSVSPGTLGVEATGREARILRYAPGISPMVRSLMLTRNPLGDVTDALLDVGTLCGVEIVRVSPSDPSLLGHRLETDKGKLMALEELGYSDGVSAFSKAGDLVREA